MVLRCVFLVFFGCSLWAQNDLAAQLKLVKEMFPSATRYGFIFSEKDSAAEAMVAIASSQSGLVTIKSPIKEIRDVSGAIRVLLGTHEVDFLVIAEDRMLTSDNSIKFVVKQTVKKMVPVFTTSENALSGGAYGRFVNEGGEWRLKVNGKVKDLFTNITVPSGNSKITVEE